MNKIFTIKWNSILNIFVVCHEKSKSHPSNSPSTSSKGLVGSIAFITQQFKFKKFIFLSSVISLFTPLYLLANPLSTELPKGAEVVIGNVTINTNQNSQSPVMNVNQASQRAVVNWNSFNVGSDTTVNFNQPNPSASILNRISNQSPSQIFGKINANGEVILMNPAGIYFGKSSSLDVGALTATTHNISNEDFMKGLMTFDRNGSVGSIINDGSITANFNSYIALLAPEVRNSGLLIAKMGTVVMASGEKITLNFDSDHHLGSITSDPSTIKSLIENNYAVEVEGGRIILSANAINTIAGSLINQNGLLNAGSNASQLVKQGGQILLLADTVNLNNGSQTLANGLFGGGEIFVGGSWQNSNPTFIQALKTSVADLALIQANATDIGKGGTIVIWSDITNKNSLTNVQGTIEAKGGFNGGDGGKIETSGHQVYLDGIKISASANLGSSGTWLIDPYDVVIGTSVSGTAYSDSFIAGASSYILASSINTSLNAGTNVSISTGSNSANTITLNTAISKTSGGNATLSLTGGTININQTISGSSASGSLGITLNAQTINSNYLMSTNGGVLDITSVNASTLNAVAGSGQFNLHGYGITLNDSRNGTYTGATTIDSGATLQLNYGGLDGDITNNGTLFFNDPQTINYAGVISGTGALRQDNGALFLTGANTYASTTTINSGTLRLGNNGTTGSINSSSNVVNNNSTLQFYRSNAMTFANDISGTGSVSILENGTSTAKGAAVTFTGTNTYTGTTYINNHATLQLGNAGTTGSLASGSNIAIAYGATLKLNRSDDVTLANYIYNNGSHGIGHDSGRWQNNVIQAGTGTTTLSNASSNWYGTATINDGTLKFTGAAGNGANYIINNGKSLIFNSSSNQDFNNLSGTGTFTKSGTGTLTLNDSRNGTYTGATTIDSGATLQLNYGGLDGDITNNGTLFFNDPQTINYAGVISGTGALRQDNGALFLTGANTYASTTTINSGTLRLGNNGTTGSINSSSNVVNNNSTLQFYRSNAMTFANDISGTGSVSILENGTSTAKGAAVTFTGTNTYTGTTYINNHATLQLGNAGTTGSLASGSNIAIAYGATLKLNRSDDVTLANYIYNNGSHGIGHDSGRWQNNVIQAGTGTTTLSNASSNWYGTATINDGTLKFTGAAGNGANYIINNGKSLIFNSSSNQDFNNLSGTGTFTKSGTGTLTLNDSRNGTYTGATTIDSGATLQLNYGGLDGDITNNGTLFFNDPQTINYAGVISGTGALRQDNGALFLTGANTYASTTTINSGTLRLGNNGTTGSINSSSNVVNNNSTLQFYRSNAMTFANDISGTGSVSILENGTSTAKGAAVTFTGTNTYTGTTYINNHATLQLGNAGTTGSLASGSNIAIAYGATLKLNRSDDVTLANYIYNNGSHGIGHDSGRWQNNVIQAGTGTTTLSNASSNWYGTATINDGTLKFTGAAGNGANYIINNGKSLIFNSSSNQDFNNLSGTGTFTKSGTGTLTLNDSRNGTYTGATTIDSGATLQLNYGGLDGDITNNGTLFFNDPQTINYAGVISGTGALRQDNGALFLTGANTYASTTTINSGTLRLGNNGTTGSINSSSNVVNNNSTLQFYRSNAMTFANDISGTGSVSILENGTSTAKGAAVTFTGTNTYTGTTYINNHATLQLGNAGTTGSLASGSNIAIAYGATLKLNRSDDVTLANYIYNNGSHGIGHDSGRWQNNVIQAGTGTTTLSNASSNWYGTATINDGTLKFTGAAGNGANYIINNGKSLIFNSSSNQDFNNLSGTGTFTKSGTGTLTLNDSRNGTYTGATTIDSGATLQLNYGGLDGDITNNGTLFFNDPQTINYAGVISGTGALRQDNGALFLTGANTYASTTTINSGTLRLGNNGTTGSINSSSNVVNNNSTLQFYRSNAMTFANDISGTGSVSILENGTSTAKGAAVTFTGTNTYTGTTYINNHATLQLGNAGTTGSLASGSNIAIAYGATLKLNRSDDVTLANYIYNNGSHGIGHDSGRWQNNVIQAGTGTTTLSNASSNWYGTATINDGTLKFTGAAGNGANYIINNGKSLIFNSSSNQDFNNLSGTGTFTKSGTGTLTLNDSRNGTYTGATTIDSGATLQLNYGGLDGDITNNGTLFFNDPQTINYAGVISGTGALRQDNGALFLTGANTYASTTTINSGTLRLGNNGTTGSINSSSNVVNNNSTLQFYRSNAMTFANDISGTGSVSILENGTSTAKGAAVTFTGTNTYTGTTYINNHATLQLGNAGTTGSLASGSNIAIAYGATLKLNRSDDVTLANYIYNNGSHGIGHDSGRWQNNVIQAGTGTTTLSNASSNWYGTATINDGSLTFANTGSFGNGSNQISFGGGAIKYVAANKTDYSNKFSTTANQQYAVDVNGQAITWATALNSSGGSLTVRDSAGSGSLNLTANNTYSGATNINGGNLTFSGSGAASSSTALNVGGSASFTLSNTSALSNTGSMSLSVESGGNLTLSANRTFGSISGAGNIILGSNILTTGSNNNSTTYSGVMSGTGALSKTGTGTLTLSGTNTYSGGTTISNGTIKLGSVAGLGTSNASVSSGATLDLNGQTAVTNNLSLNGTGVSSRGALYNSSTSGVSTSGNITLTGNTTIKSLGDITLNGTVQSSSNGSLTIDATGKTVTLNGLIGADPTTFIGTSALNPSSVTVTGNTINLNNDISGGIETFNGAMNVGDNGSNGTIRTVLAVGTSPSTTFNGTINDTVANTHRLNIRSVTTSINNTPTITFNGDVGQVKALAGMETTAMYQPTASSSVYGLLPATIDTSSNYSGTINVNGAFKTTGDQTFTGKTFEFATNQPATISGNINIYGYSATSGGANTSTINIPGFKVTSGTQTIKGLSAAQLLAVTKTVDRTIDPNFVATVSGSGGSTGTNNLGRVKFDAGLGSKIIKEIIVLKSVLSSPMQSGGSLKPSINIGEVYIDGLSNNIGAPVITNNFSQPGVGNAFIRQTKDQ